MKASDLTIAECTMGFANRMYERHHSVRNMTEYGKAFNLRGHSFALMLTDGAETFGVAILGDVSDDRHSLELRTMTMFGEKVKYGASRFVGLIRKHVRQQFSDVRSLVTYSSEDLFRMTMYKATGWETVSTFTMPDGVKVSRLRLTIRKGRTC